MVIPPEGPDRHLAINYFNQCVYMHRLTMSGSESCGILGGSQLMIIVLSLLTLITCAVSLVTGVVKSHSL